MILSRVAERVARGRVLEADGRGDVAGAHFLDLLALVGVHLQQPADALLLALHRVVDRVAGIQHAGVDAEEGELADERVGHDLERERRERLVVVGLARRSAWPFSSLALHRRDVDRRRHVVDHRVEHRLHALVLERRAAQHRDDLARRSCACAGPCLISSIESSPASRYLFISSSFASAALSTIFSRHSLAIVEQLGRDLAQVELHALGRLVPVDRLHPDEVDHALELVLGADRNLDRDRVRLEARLHLVVDLEEVRARAGPSCSRTRGAARLYLLAWRQTVSDCGCTPPTAQ